MAAAHHEDTPETGAHPAGRRAPVSRRAMLRTAAGASAAGAAGLVASGALAAIPAAAAARRPAGGTGHSGASTPEDRAADGPLVIHVRDARTGEMDVFEGTACTRLRDPELAARLVRASR